MLNRADRLGKIMAAPLLALILGGLVALVVLCFRSPRIAFVTACSRAQWIAYPTRPEIKWQLSDYRRPAIASFSRSFDAGTGKRIVLSFRAFRTAGIYLNGRPVPFSARPNWKTWTEVDVTARVREGRNVLRVDVANPKGPPLLCLYADGVPSLNTKGSWSAELNGQPETQAIVADDCREPEAVAAQPTTLDCAAENWPLLAVAFAVSCAAFLVRSKCPRWIRQNPGLLTAIAVSVAWVYLSRSYALANPQIGFDAGGHLRYILHVLRQHALPAPNEYYSSYHPPLYYVLAALACGSGTKLFGNLGGLVTLKSIAFLSGLGSIWVAYLLARRLYGTQGVKTALAVLFAGILPMNIYISAYASNESTHALLAGLATLLTVCAIHEQKSRLRTYAGIGVILGLALLSKYTALVVAPLLIAALALKLIVIEKPSAGRAARLLLVVVLLPLLIGGWFYGRNAAYTGNPLYGNWDYLKNGQGWWQQPGFHTSDYYLSFGGSVLRPYSSSFGSYWDALYSTMWGDGQIGGQTELTDENRIWNYDLMSVGYLLAIPATLLIGAGFLLGIRKVLRESDAGRRISWWLMIMLVLTLGFAMVAGTLKLSYYGQAKAFYGLALLGPLALFAASGFGTMDDVLKRRRITIGRTLLYGWLGTLTTVIFLSFVSPG